MASALPLASRYRGRQSPRRRLASIALAAGVVALLLFALIRLGTLSLDPFRPQPRLSTFDIAPAPTVTGERTPQRAKAKQAPRGAKPPPRPAVTAPQPPAPPPAPVTPNAPPMIVLSQEEFAASDISKMRSATPDSGTDGRKGEAGSGAGDSAVAAGTGPNGQKMYNAEWYRKPRDAELGPYLPHNVDGPQWARIACRTIDHYHVDDCREMGESPAGSGLSRALRQAAWQFLVRPPRIDGKPQIGTWVLIHFDFTRAERRDD